jgi:hypothetical protein
MPVSLVVDDPEFAKFVQLTDAVSKLYAADLKRWSGSPFAWILTLSSRSRGAAAEKIVDSWLVGNGFSVRRATHSGCDRIVNGVNIEIKFSTLWKSGGYKFQQLRDQDYESVFCLGISPAVVHAWLIPKSVAWQNAVPQHGGSKGKDTKWLVFQADDPPAWLSKYGGSLGDVLTILREAKRLG